MSTETLKVCWAIPTMGYTHAEAYCNRIVNGMHLAHIEQQQRSLSALVSVLQEEADKETARRIMKKFLEREPLYYELPDGRRIEFFFAVLGRLFTPFAREQAAKMALSRDCDYLFMVDDDMMCPDDLFERLIRHNVDIVAPLAFTRNYPHKPVIYSSVEGWDPVSRQAYFQNTVVWNYPKEQLVECDAVGFGAVLIKMSVFKRMAEPYFMLTPNTGEDIAFCYAAKKSGARVFVDTSTKLGHLGSPVNVTEEYVIEQRKKDVPDFHKIHSVYDKYKKNGLKSEPTFVSGE